MLIRTFERSLAISVRFSLVRYSVIDREEEGCPLSILTCVHNKQESVELVPL